MPHSTAQQYLRAILKESQGPKKGETDMVEMVAMGLLAVAEGLESVASSIDELAKNGGDGVAKALGEGLGDMESALSKIGDKVGELDFSR
jgi:hypothetical protein